MPDFLNSPIIVTGCARSGTSLVAGILHHCGAWIGKCTGPTRHNKKGQFENEEIRDQLTKPFLKSIGADPMGQDPLPDLGCRMLQHRWSSDVSYAILNQGYGRDRPWMFKGAKACLIWPVWHMAFPKARWVLVRRADERIVDSCMRTSFMRKRRTPEAWQEWVNHHKRCFESMKEAGLNLVEIWSDVLVRTIRHDVRIPKMLVENLGLIWNEEKVMEFVDPKLWHGEG